MKRKLVYLDVGTHLGQEFMALLGHSPAVLWWKFFKIWVASVIIRSKVIHSIEFNEAIKIFRSLKALRANKADIYSILIEPNYRVFGAEAYQIANKVFCIALGDESKPIGFEKLYFPDSFKMSQGASLYKSKNNVDLSGGDAVVVVNSSEFASLLKQDLDSRFGENQYELVIRLNCEGAEDSVIYAFKDRFKSQFNYVFGSLKDVGELKGHAELDALYDFLKDTGLEFTQFSPLYPTWHRAFSKIGTLIS